MFNFRLFNFKEMSLITSVLAMTFWAGSSAAMENSADRTVDEMVDRLSIILSPETWEQFSTHSSDIPLGDRINDFLQINTEFLTNDEVNCFHDTMESIQTQQSISQSIKSKNKNEQTRRDEAIALQIEQSNRDEQIRSDEELARNGQRPISSQVQRAFKQLESGDDAQKISVGKFREILVYLKSKENTLNLDVHFFDPYIFGPQKKILDLIKFGNFLHVDNGGLSLAQVGQEMTLFITNHPTLFVDFKYVDKLVPIEGKNGIKDYVNRHFRTMDAESAKICPEAKIMWSKTWSLAYNLYTLEDNTNAIKIIFEQVCENYLTQGGCIQGRINRGFVGYVCLLTNCCGLGF